MEQLTTSFQRGVGTSQAEEAKLVTAAVTLQPNETRVECTIPLAVANHYHITLPKPETCPGAEFAISAVRASGSYVDGTVVVTAPAGLIAGWDSDALTARGDYVIAKNYAGFGWVQVAEKTST